MKCLTAIPAALLLFCSSQLQAQTNNSTLRQQALQYNRYLIHSIEKQQQARMNNKGTVARTTGAPERLVAICKHYPNANGIDSSTFIYSGNRSSAFDFNTMSYEIGYIINQSNQIPMPMGLPVDLNTVGHDNVPEVLADSCIRYQSVFGSALSLIEQEWSSYDGNNNVVLFGDHNTNLPLFSKLINAYDANQNMVNSLEFNWDGTAWDTVGRRRLSYNGNMVATDTSDSYQSPFGWATVTSCSYTYNGSGKLTNIVNHIDGGTPLEEFSISYNSDNTLRQDSVSINLNGVWLPIFKDSVGYTSGVNYISFERAVNYDDTGALNTHDDYSKHIINSLTDTVFYSHYDFVSNTTQFLQKIAFAYDSYNNPVTATEYDANDPTVVNGGYNLNSVEIFYYQASNTAVNTVAKQAIEIKVYPNPATNEITISQTGIQQGAVTHITLMNALGQTIQAESLPWMNSTETISVAGLKTGNYWLVIQDKNGNVLSRQAIVKE